MVYIVVEGPTEQTFIKEILNPEMSLKNIFLYPVRVGKPGHKGGDIRFERAKADIINLLKQRSDTYITTMFDYYGINSEWPGRNVEKSLPVHEKASRIVTQTLQSFEQIFPDIDIKRRFIPYFSMYEFEALLFSSPQILSQEKGLKEEKINDILKQYKIPENINDNPETAPSKRLKELCDSKYYKIKDGNKIAKETGIKTIREKCPIFNSWLEKIEHLK